MILSVGSYGCNLSCPFCQNYEISMIRPGNDQSANACTAGRSGYEAAGEPEQPEPEHTGWRMMQPEEIADLAEVCQDRGNIGVAFTYNEPLTGYEFVRDTARLVHERGMKNVLVTNGMAELTVKSFIKRAADACHVELTTLIVPGENDSVEEMERETEWIASVSPEIVLHVTRFFPRYRMMDRDATDVRAVYRLRDAAGKHLKYVYTGNC